jgi:hypothetical protein
MRNKVLTVRVKLTIRAASLIFVFAAAVGLTGTAHAADADCSDRNGEACPSKDQTTPDASPSMRASLDKARADLADKLFGLQLSAFGDVQSDVDNTGKRKLEWGSLELDAAADFSDNTQAALALVLTRDDTTVTTGFVDYHTFGGHIAPRGRLWVEKGFHVQAGRFDVPFGNDWQFFASKDSVSISRPLTTALVMEGGYNDTGFRMLGNNGTVNFNTYLLHGFNRGRLVGGRVGLTPFSDPFSLKGAQEPKTLELGLSYLYDANSSGKKNEMALAADGELHLNAWTARFESIVRKKEASVAGERTTVRGWHITQEFGLGEVVSWPTMLFGRYEVGAVQPSEIATSGGVGDERDVRVAAGVSSNLFSGNVVQWKFEAQHYLQATPSTRDMPGFSRSIRWLMQLVLVL